MNVCGMWYTVLSMGHHSHYMLCEWRETQGCAVSNLYNTFGNLNLPLGTLKDFTSKISEEDMPS